MIKAEILKDTGKGWRVNGEITLYMIGERLQIMNNQEYGAPIRIYGEQIKSGGLLNSSIENCLVIENMMCPKDYFKFCITTRRQGRQTLIPMYYYGWSALTGRAHQVEENRRSGSLGGLIINALIGVNQAAYNAEYDYYEMVNEMFGRLFN